jgi:Winged helix DNA-binding domain
MAARRIGVGERRARLARRHHLAAGSRAASPVQAASSMVGLHGTDPSSVYLAAGARMPSAEPATIERALYEDRELVRLLGMRRTMFVVPLDLAPVVQAACTRAIAVQERRRTVQLLTQCGVADDPGAWLADLEEATVRVLATHGAGTAAELSVHEPRLRTQLMLAEGKSYAASQSVVTRVLMQLAAEGRIIRGRPRGSWTSSQYRWAPIQEWLGEGIDHLPTDTARVELARRWLWAFGPGTVADLKWWTGWTAGEVKRAVEKLGAVEADLDGGAGLVLPDDLEPEPEVEPWVALLPALDPTVMGWAGRAWYLGEHGRALFDRNGNAGPTIWWDGRIVGGWAHRKNGEVAFRLLEDVGADAANAVTAAAERLRTWIGDVRITPRFRTPLERELSA